MGAVVSGATYDRVTVRWADGETIVGTPAATNSREGFIEDSSLTSEAQATEYGTQWLALHGTIVDQVDIGLTPLSGAMTPWDGLNKGDALRSASRAGTDETGRIYGVGFTGLRRNGVPDWSVTLGSATQERAVRAQRQLTKTAQGSMRDTFAAAAPSPAPSFGKVDSGQLPKTNLPVADADEFSLTYPFDRTKPYPFTEATSIIRFQCQCESLVGSADTTIDVYKITYAAGVPTETVVETFTWPGSQRRYQVIVDLPYAVNESYQLRCTAAGAHALHTIQPIGSSTN